MRGKENKGNVDGGKNEGPKSIHHSCTSFEILLFHDWHNASRNMENAKLFMTFERGDIKWKFYALGSGVARLISLDNLPEQQIFFLLYQQNPERPPLTLRRENDCDNLHDDGER